MLKPQFPFKSINYNDYDEKETTIGFQSRWLSVSMDRRYERNLKHINRILLTSERSENTLIYNI